MKFKMRLGEGYLLRKQVGFILLVGLSIIWGLAFVAIRRADFELSPVNLALLRWFIAGGIFLALIPVFGTAKTKFERRDLPRLLLVSLMNVAVYHLSLNYAETIVSSGLAGLLISFGPMFAVVLSVIFLHERVGRRLSAALLLGFLGALILSLASQDFSFRYLSGPVAVILSALAYAVFAVASKPLVMKYGTFWTAAWAAVTGTVMILPLVSGPFVGQVESISVYAWASVVYLAVGSTVIGYLIFYALVSSRAVSSLSVQLYLIPLVSVIGGVLILGENISTATILGGVILLGAVYLATTSQASRPESKV
jgi:drug/metabolite transporter (DMT)-like permease